MAGKKQGKKELFWGWVFFAPTLAGLLVLNIIPISRPSIKAFSRPGHLAEETGSWGSRII